MKKTFFLILQVIEKVNCLKIPAPFSQMSCFSGKNLLTLSRRRSWSYRNQSIDLQSKSMDWFLYGNGLRLERVNLIPYLLLPPQMNFATLFVMNRTTPKSWDILLFYVHDCLKLFFPLCRFHNNSSYWKYQYFCLRQKFYREKHHQPQLKAF